MGGLLTRPEVTAFRKIDVLRQGIEISVEQTSMASNNIHTSKYNVISFVPKSLFEQFRRVANVYFLVISMLMVVGTYTTLFTSPLQPFSTLFPLIFVLLVTMVKDGAEDLKRHRSDKKVNNSIAQTMSLDRRGVFEEMKWRDISVGRIVKVMDKEEIPADIVLLCTSETGGVGYIETANIDGETNLKIRSSAPTREGTPPGPEWSNPEELYDVPMEVEYETPNPRIHFFTGTLRVAGLGGGNGDDWREVAVDQSHLLLRGSRLRNTKWALGVVVYTGKESKILQNARAAPSKQSNLDKVTNKIMFVIFFAMALITTLSLVGYIIFSAEYDDDLFYLCLNSSNSPIPLFRDNCDSSTSTADLGQWFTFLILYNNFIPISLYVTLEMVNAIQASFIDEDLEMYDKEQDTPALARTSNMNGDLGQVEYVFSDKTGTLTQNVMKFKRCSVEGQVYGELSAEDRALLTPAQLERVVEAPPLHVLSSKVGRDSTKGSNGEGAAALDFVACLALNHTVVLEVDEETGMRQMQSESPDEEALVDGGKMLGIEFVDRTPDGKVIVHLDELGEKGYELLLTIPFNSTRKRMSVIVRGEDGSIVLYCKGADNIIMDRAESYVGCSRSTIEEHLGVFANDGLRTLLLARRNLPKSFYHEWHQRYREASVATDMRSEKIAEVAKEVECELEVLGATAIEDKLQDDVPTTIADIGKAGVKLWVLTGDKMETAINIGYSARLLEPHMTLIKLREKDGETKSVHHQLELLLTHFTRLVDDEKLIGKIWGRVRSGVPLFRNRGSASSGPSLAHPSSDVTGTNAALPEPLLEQPEGALPLSQLTSDALALVVDGPSLGHVLGNPDTEQMFLTIGGMCKSVIACRVSPAQKRLLVRLVKRGVQPTPITLAIGDGANDVGMIQEAQLGVGISGKEGRQAVNNADFAIAQFRFLKRLMLVHGHWNYRRLCKVILYSFYKNIALTFMLFYFNFYTGFSGQSLVESLVYSGFNWFLGMPILCVGLFDQDVSAGTALEAHKLYAVGRLNMDLNIKVMVKGLLQAIADSLIVFFLPFAAYSDAVTVWAERGYGDGLYVFGTTAYSCLIMSMMLKVSNMTKTWTKWNVFYFVGSLILYFGFLTLYSLNSSFAYDFYYVAIQMYSRSTYWLLLFQVPLVSWMLDTIIRTIEREFFTTVGDHASEFDKGLSTKREDVQVWEKVRRKHSIRGGTGFLTSHVSPVEEVGPKRDLKKGKWTVSAASLRVLNEGLAKDDLDAMGLLPEEGSKGRSAFAYDHVSSSYGRGASTVEEEIDDIVSKEGEDGVRRRSTSLRNQPLGSSEKSGAFEEKS